MINNEGSQNVLNSENSDNKKFEGLKNLKNSMNLKKSRSNKNKKKSVQEVAQRRIDELFKIAEEFFELNPKYSNDCVKLARKISLRYKVSFSKEQKIMFCKKCDSYLMPSKTSRLRVFRGKIKVLCLNCKNIYRYMYK